MGMPTRRAEDKCQVRARTEATYLTTYVISASVRTHPTSLVFVVISGSKRGDTGVYAYEPRPNSITSNYLPIVSP